MNFHFLTTLITTLLLSNTLYAKTCFKVNDKDIAIEWTAFKTPAKVGVKGSLPNVKYTGAKTASSIKSLINKASVTIDANDVATKNPARDKKISNFFFGNMSSGKTIKATVAGLTKKHLKLNITMNGQTKMVPMTYELKGSTLKASGHMDILDFSMSKSLEAINKACKALHEGKTWSDVELRLNVNFQKC